MEDRAGPIRDGEQLATERLQTYLAQQLGDDADQLTLQQFRSGYSNLTYQLQLGDRDLVLRRPPFGNLVKSAHDMSREYRVLSHLSRVYPPAPKPLLYCDDSNVIGDEFYVMERRCGVIFRGPETPEVLAGDTQLTRDVCRSLVENLATLHQLDYQAVGLADLGRPQGYIQRQVAGWSQRYEAAKTGDCPEIEQLAAWLASHQPTADRAALIHNDYKYDNVMLGATKLTHIEAVLDWEMATVGDPLMDLGTTLAYWVEAGDPAPLRALAFGPTMVPGSLTRREIVDYYTQCSGIDVGEPLFYYAFGLFKLAVIVQQIYARYVRGKTSDERFAQLDQIVSCLGHVGVNAIGRGDIVS